MLQDNDLLSKYSKIIFNDFVVDLKDGVFVHAFITEQIFKKEPTHESNNTIHDTSNNLNTSTQQDGYDEKMGFDRLL